MRMTFWRKKVCSDRATAEFKGNSVPIERKLPRTGVGDEGTSTSLVGPWLTAGCSPTMVSGERCPICSVPRERFEGSSMVTSVTRDSVDSWGVGGISAVAVISSRTSSMLIPAFVLPSPSEAVARIDE